MKPEINEQENGERGATALAVLNQLPEAIMVLQPDPEKTGAAGDFTLKFANHKAKKLFGISENGIEGLLISRLFKEDWFSAQQEPLQQLTVSNDDGRINLETYTTDAVQLLVTAEKIGIQGHILLRFVENTPGRQADREFLIWHNQRLLERVTRNIIHEIGNPLGGMSLALETLETKVDDQQGSSLEVIELNVDRISLLLKELHQAIRLPQLSRKEVSLHGIITEALATAGQHIALRQVKVDWQADGKAYYLQADEELLTIAFFNIITNALEAMDFGGGQLKISAWPFSSGHRVLIQDNGHGISAEQVNFIFEPLATEKKRGKGLGLTRAQSIFLAHGAFVHVESKEEGSKFYITFT